MLVSSIISAPEINVLIVDDNLDNLNVLSEMLAEENYKVRRAINGAIALRAIEALKPNLILLDINMPDLTGHEVCSILKQNSETADIPIIFISALNQITDKVKAFANGGVDYISKPFELAELIARIENQLKIQHAQAEIQTLNADLERRVQARTAQLEAAKAELEERVQSRTAHLLSANRELEAFAYTLSHDLQTSLSVIFSNTEILQSRYTEHFDEMALRHLSRIGNSAQQMGQQIREMLTLHQLGQKKLDYTSVDLSQLAQEILATRQEIEPDRQAEIQIEPDLMVWGDPVLLRSVLDNLLSNAWKYSSKCPVTRIWVGVLQNSDSQRTFYVRDQGAGFDIAKSEKLFQPFHRMHSATDFPGTGVGLASVQKIILKHGGQIAFESEVNQGATFYFTLPAQGGLPETLRTSAEA